MDFDPNTAQPFDVSSAAPPSGGFDPSTATDFDASSATLAPVAPAKVGNAYTSDVSGAWGQLKSDFEASQPDKTKFQKSGFWDQQKQQFDQMLALGKLPVDAFNTALSVTGIPQAIGAANEAAGRGVAKVLPNVPAHGGMPGVNVAKEFPEMLGTAEQLAMPADSSLTGLGENFKPSGPNVPPSKPSYGFDPNTAELFPEKPWRFKKPGPDTIDAVEPSTPSQLPAPKGFDPASAEPISESPTQFTTAKGSTYEVNSDGTTTRNKAARSDIGHEGQFGPQPQSEATFYVTPEHANELSLFQTQGGQKMAVAQTKDGRLGVKYLSGKDAGKFEKRTVAGSVSQPAPGLIPVETWNDGTRVHFGNEITEVHPSPPSPPPHSDEGFRTTPGAIAAEHAADVSSLEAQGAQLAGEKHIPKLGGDGSPENPVIVTEPQDLDLARERVEQPSEAQKDAGNYQKGHIELQGLPITIENPIGSTRSGVGADGEPWSVQMPADYGYIKRTVGADNDHVDTYIGPNPKSDRVFIIDQNDAHTGQFDEHKAFIGFDSPEQVTSTYRGAFSDNLGQERIGAVHELTISAFKEQLKSGAWDKPLSAQPLAERKPGSELPSTPFNMYMDDRAYTPKEQSFINDVKDIAGRIMPDANVSVFNRIRQGEDKVTGLSFANGLKDAVAISLESKNLVRTTQHEAIHFLRNYLTHDEWATLENTADKEGWHDKHNIDERYGELPDDIKTEEAIASEFGDYRSGKPTSHAASPIFAKMKDFLDNLKTAFRRRFGTKATAQDIFKDIHEGVIGKRTPRNEAVQPKTEAGGEGGIDGEPPGDAKEFGLPKDAEAPGNLFRWIRGQEDDLTRIRGNNEADRTEALNYIKSLPDTLRDPIVNERLYHNIEDPAGNPLTPEEQALSDKYLAPIRQEANEVFNRIRASGLPIGMDGYVHRIVKGKGSMYDPAEGPPAANAFGSGRGLGRKAPSMNARTMWMAEGEDGTKFIVNGDFKPGDEYTAQSGEKFKIRQATTKEIEDGSDLRYFKNAVANSLDNLLRLRRVERNINYLETLKSDPNFFSLASPPGSQMRSPASWKGTGLPQLRGWIMEPRIAKMLDNFYEVGPQGDLAQALAKVNHGLTSAIFVNPISALFGHGLNVAAHWYVGRGWDNFMPQKWARQSVNMMRAFNDVWKETPRYQQMLREGNSLMYAPTVNRDFHQSMIKLMGGEVKKQPKKWSEIAKMAGTSPKHIYQALGNLSSKGLWMANDIFMLQRVYDLMDKGYDTRSAIAEAEHEIPNYRIPTEAWDGAAGRAFSELMRNPNIFIFSRYRYGLIHAYAKTIGDFVGKNVAGKDRAKAAGQMLALGVLFGVLYPMADQVAKGLTGNKKATMRRSGPATVLQSLLSSFQGKPKGDDSSDFKNLYTGISGLFGPAPGTLALSQALVNRDFFTGKHIYNPEGKPGEIAGELGMYGASQPYPVQQAEELAGGRKDRHEIESSWLGINDPTQKELANRRRYATKDYVADRKAFNKKLQALRRVGNHAYHSVFGAD